MAYFPKETVRSAASSKSEAEAIKDHCYWHPKKYVERHQCVAS